MNNIFLLLPHDYWAILQVGVRTVNTLPNVMHDSEFLVHLQITINDKVTAKFNRTYPHFHSIHPWKVSSNASHKFTDGGLVASASRQAVRLLNML